MTIGMNISNKVKKYADELERKKKTDEAAAKILESTAEPESKVNESEEKVKTDETESKGEYLFTDNGIKIPKEIGVDFNSSNPVGELFKIDDYYKAKTATSSEPKVQIELERISEPSQTEDDIIEAVKASLDADYTKSKQKTLDDYSRLTQAQVDAKEQAEINSKTATQKINDYYDQATEAASNNVLKRGLARSSIAVLEIDGLTKERAQQLSREAQNLSDQLNQIDGEIGALKAKQENALVYYGNVSRVAQLF